MNELDVQQRARSFVASVDISNIHIDLDCYVQAANARVKKEELNKGESGYTITNPKGKHLLTINSLETEERQRFTICHEIAHIILDLDSSHGEVPSWSYSKRHINEVWCDMFAAELLMPYQLWLKEVPDAEPSVEVINLMANKFGTSFPAAASRYATLSNLPCAFVTMDSGLIRHSARSLSLRKINAWVEPRSPIPTGSMAHNLRIAGESADNSGEVSQDIWFSNWDPGSDLYEVARHYQPSDTTVSLLWFEADDLPEVEHTRFGVRVTDDGGLSELTGELSWPSKSRRR